MMIPTRSQSSRNAMTTCSRAPQKRGAPPFKVSSADPQTTTYNGHVLNDRDRENSFSRTRGSGMSVILKPCWSLCAGFGITVPCAAHCTNLSLCQQPAIPHRQISIHQGLNSNGDQYPGHTTNDIFGIPSQTILDLFHIENFGWP